MFKGDNNVDECNSRHENQPDFSAIEDSLRSSAQAFQPSTDRVSVGHVMANLRQRRRDRLSRHAFAYALGTVATVFAILGVAVWQIRPTPVIDQGLVQEVGGHPSPVIPHAGRNEMSRTNTPYDRSLNLPRTKYNSPTQSPVHSSAKNTVSHSPHVVTTAPASASSTQSKLQQILDSTVAVGPFRVFKNASTSSSNSDPIPVLVEVTHPDGQVGFAPGWIVPERTGSLDWSQLNSAQRHAVRQVLELENNPESSDQPVI